MINDNWDLLLNEEFRKEYFIKLMKFLDEEYKSKVIYPKREEIFKAFDTKYEDIKVVILGQDPYHGENEAEGLAFSVKKGIKIPPSLRNIYKELKDDLGIEESLTGSLVHWSNEGVFLLNTVLTVVKDNARSHADKGWEELTDSVIKIINDREKPVVFILWGSDAQSKKKLITNKNHLILESSHPSPLSSYRSFFGSRPFSKTNDFLIKNNMKPIDWKIKDTSL